MSTYILTSMFNNGFNSQTAEVFRQKILKRNKFAFVASEFVKIHEKTDKYFRFFLNMFEESDIHFVEASPKVIYPALKEYNASLRPENIKSHLQVKNSLNS